MVNLLAESGCYSVLCSAPHKAEVRSTASLSANAASESSGRHVSNAAECGPKSKAIWWVEERTRLDQGRVRDSFQICISADQVKSFFSAARCSA